jgi:hypothetical protein
MLKRLFHTVALSKGRISYDLEDVFQFIHETRILYGDADPVSNLFFMFKVCSEGHAWSLTDYRNNSRNSKTNLSQWLTDFQYTLTELRHLMYDKFLIRSSNSELLTNAKRSYAILPELFPMKKATVFTTNFDTVFEAMQSAGDLNWTLRDGISQQRNPPFSFENFIGTRSADLFYFKLHGSVTWERTAETSIVDCYPMVPESVALLEPVISKLPTGFPFAEMYQIFERVLRHNRIFVSIGFSFRDDTIRSMVIDRLKSSMPFRLIILAPDDNSSSEANRYLNEMEQFRNVERIKEYFGTDEAFLALRDAIQRSRALLSL